MSLHAQDGDRRAACAPGDTLHCRMLAVGADHQLDTYLSPEAYDGTALRYVATHSRSLRRHATLRREWSHEAHFTTTRNRARNNTMLGAHYRLGYALRRQWQPTERLHVEAGGGVEGLVGFLYSTRGGNNPAQARLSVQLSPSAALAWRMPVRRPLMLRYAVSSPLCGLAFSPNYGQSYYELFNEGHYDHNMAPTSCLAAPSLRQLLAVDFRLLGRTVRVGYLGDYSQTHVNHLKYHSYTHALVVGIVK